MITKNLDRTNKDHKSLKVQLNKLDKYFVIKSTLERDEGKCTIAVTNLRAYISVLNITELNKVFTLHTPGYWQDPPNTIKFLVIIF